VPAKATILAPAAFQAETSGTSRDKKHDELRCAKQMFESQTGLLPSFTATPADLF
jgi:hypothetical protein